MGDEISLWEKFDEVGIVGDDYQLEVALRHAPLHNSTTYNHKK